MILDWMVGQDPPDPPTEDEIISAAQEIRNESVIGVSTYSAQLEKVIEEACELLEDIEQLQLGLSEELGDKVNAFIARNSCADDIPF